MYYICAVNLYYNSDRVIHIDMADLNPPTTVRLSAEHKRILRVINDSGVTTRQLLERAIEKTAQWVGLSPQRIVKRDVTVKDTACPLCNKLPGDRRCFNHKEKTQ